MIYSILSMIYLTGLQTFSYKNRDHFRFHFVYNSNYLFLFCVSFLMMFFHLYGIAVLRPLVMPQTTVDGGPP